VIFLESELDRKVAPEGWREWHPGETERLKTAFYAEYRSRGEGAAAEKREAYSRQLSDSEAVSYRAASYLAGKDGWDPSKP
jgi:Pectinesterase